MNIHVDAPIQSLLADRRPGYTLPAEFYVSQAAFEVDLKVFFRRHWIFAGVEADVPEPGDVRTVDVGKSSVILLRDDDNVIRGFHNVCRHRGARLVSEEKASVGRLVCPYHQWSYDLNGDLVHASQMGSQFDKSCFGLKPIHVRNVAGLLLICIADECPEDIEDFEAAIAPRLAALDLSNTKIAHETVIVEEGNWKLSIDNNRECYHCAGSHPELSEALNPLDVGFDPDALAPDEIVHWTEHLAETERAVARWESQGFPSKLVEEMTGRATLFRSQRFVIADAGESHTMDTRAACRKPLGGLEDKRMGDLHLWTHNSWHHFFADHAVVSYLIPLSPSRTMLRTVWLVHKDAEEGRDYDLERLTEVWTATNRQDADLVGLAQKGVETSGYAPGPLSPFVERLVDLNLGWYVERLRAHGY